MNVRNISFILGDLIPISNQGKIFGSCFIICGILIAFLPVPILAAKFQKSFKDLSDKAN